ncbi:MAG: hypothetical protein ACRCW2_13450 [Cellulosilyticaceae bacterium]
MELLNYYETYTAITKDYDRLLQELVDQENLQKEDGIYERLAQAKDKLEQLMQSLAELEVDEAQQHNLGDLKYLVTDLFFLAMDCVHFYGHEEMGRFKMRAINYLNKKRRAEIFG